MEIVLGITSGPSFAGKSLLMKYLRSLPTFATAPVIEMDKVRQRVWGKAMLTQEEHRYKNELARRELEQRIIVEQPLFILAEFGMPTRTYHHLPMVEMVRRAERTLTLIAEEKAFSEGQLLPLPTMIHLRIIQLYCDAGAMHRRVKYRNQEADESGTLVFDLSSMANDLTIFEVPIDYTPLILDTSEEDQRENLFCEAAAFLETGKLPPDTADRRRRYGASLMQSITDLRR